MMRKMYTRRYNIQSFFSPSCRLIGDPNCQSRGKATVYLAYKRLHPRITKIQKIQQGTNNEGKLKGARYRQVKQWLIMLNRLPEEK